MKIGLIRCMQTEDMCPAATSVGFACPNKEQMREAILKKLGVHIKVIGYTHNGYS